MIFFYLLITIMPLTRHPLWGKFVGDLTLFKYVGALCVLYAACYLGVRGAIPRFFQTWQARCFVLFYLLAAVSYLALGLPRPWELSPLMSYTSFLLLFFITISVVDTQQRLRWVLLVSIGSIAFASLYVLREWQKYHAIYQGFRPGWVVGDANYFTLSALAFLPLAYYLMLERRPRWERLFCLGCLVAILLAVTLAASRGGFLGLVAALLFVVWRSRQKARNFAIAGFLMVPLTFLAPSSPIERFLNPSRGTVQATETRKALWRAGLRMVAAEPITGVGLGNFKPLVGQYEESGQDLELMAHNSYLEIAAELGIPALLVFLGLLYSSFRSLEHVRRHSFRAGAPLLYQAALGTQGGLLGCAVAIFFVSGQFLKMFWFMLFLSACLPQLASQGITKTRSTGRREETRNLLGPQGAAGPHPRPRQWLAR